MDINRLKKLANIEEEKSSEWVGNIEETTVENSMFRNVLFTGKNLQLVVMSIEPNDELGMETHTGDQFIRVDQGSGLLIVNDQEYPFNDGDATVIPAGSKHNVKNTGSEPLKLYALYSPPEHKAGTQEKFKPKS